MGHPNPYIWCPCHNFCRLAQHSHASQSELVQHMLCGGVIWPTVLVYNTIIGMNTMAAGKEGQGFICLSCLMQLLHKYCYDHIKLSSSLWTVIYIITDRQTELHCVIVHCIPWPCMPIHICHASKNHLMCTKMFAHTDTIIIYSAYFFLLFFFFFFWAWANPQIKSHHKVNKSTNDIIDSLFFKSYIIY